MENLRKEDWENVWNKKGILERIVGFGRNIYSSFYLKLILNRVSHDIDMVELGCGTAIMATLLNKKIRSYTGLDYSEAAVALAKEGLKKSGVNNAEIIKEDALNLSEKQKNKFDLAWSAGFIEHFSDYSQIIKSHYDLIKSGGLILAVIPYKYSYHALWYLLTRNKYLNRFWPWENTDTKFISRKELLTAGLKVSSNAKVYFPKPSMIGFLLGIIMLEIRKN